MELTCGPDGVALGGPDARVAMGPALPGLVVSEGRLARPWTPTRLRPDGDRWVGTGHPDGLTVEVRVAAPSEERPGLASVQVRACNHGTRPAALAQLTLLDTDGLRVGEDPRRWRAYRNGYQSWAGTRSIGMDESDRDVPTALVRRSTTDASRRSPRRTGVVRSDAVSAVAEPVSGDALAVALTAEPDAFGHVQLDAPHGRLARWRVWVDLDGVEVPAGGATPWFGAVLAARSGPAAAWDALAAVVDDVGERHRARGRNRSHPAGWCSWYYYFTKVTQADVEENLGVLGEDGRDGPTFGCSYVMVDDGHQSAIGDWLDTDATAFPDGMAELARRVREAGFDAGIWWAPFLVDPRSRVARDHPDWLLRGSGGRPVVGILNPNWSPVRPMHVLDTTHPAALQHLTDVARVIGRDWGYAIQKLDFLYAASLPGVRRDRGATRAAALRRGLEAVRAGAGDDGFLLGCGCPLGPAVGVVDAMRIGADVTPYWSNAIDRVGGAGWHGLATRNAVQNVLSRAVLDGRWWLNDPDCLMVRDSETRLSEEEVRTLATVIGMTDGMIVLSDRLARVGAGRRALVATTAGLAGGHVQVADLLERARPEVVVARHADRTDVAVLNPSDHARRVTVDLVRRGVDPGPGAEGELWAEEVWTGARVPVRGGIADLGTVPAHGARVLRVTGSTAGGSSG